jgi:GT2 family glycosyltransferase
MINIGIIILNYLAYETTIQTVESFFKQSTKGYNLEYVIVDNCSPNESYQKLCDEFNEISNVHIFKTDKNIGFASGNNFGYAKLKEIMSPDFVVISNDDILLPQDGLYNWINECYKKYSFAVLGPDVYSVRGEFHQSPMNNYSKSFIKCKMVYYKMSIGIIKLRIKKIFKVEQEYKFAKWENKYYNLPSDLYTLHGSFQIFSKEYFKHYDEPYDGRTFLYMEEDILKLRCDKHSLKMWYDPSYKIRHLQAVATSMVSTCDYTKILNRRVNACKSLKIIVLEGK